MTEQRTLLDAINRLVKNSVTLKLGTITFLMLLLLIPSGMIQSIISERQIMNGLAVEETSTLWAGTQMITGPILTIPLSYERTVDGKTSSWQHQLHVLPASLDISGSLTPKTLRRGIYEVVVYSGAVSLAGDFDTSLSIDDDYLKAVHWDRALLTLGISDLRGIKEQLVMQVNDSSFGAQPGSKIRGIVASGVSFQPAAGIIGNGSSIKFQTNLAFRGSTALQFVPSGGVTTVSLDAPWGNPSFDGAFPPDERSVSDQAFEAKWQVLELNRNFPQSWIDDSISLGESAFGVRLLPTMNDYQQSMRSAKYGMLIIAMTFLTFFLVEIRTSHRIHPFQYALVGLAICLFYILLLSLSEHLKFNLAYIAASLAIVTMITSYAKNVFGNLRFTILLSLGLSSIYAFLFVILQLSDYALLMGSIGLAILLWGTMYSTRNVNWYTVGKSSTQQV